MSSYLPIHVRLALVVIAAACAVDVMWPAAASAQTATPTLVQQELVTSRASSVPSANAWGADGERLVRARNGALYTVYVAKGADREHFRWVLAKRPAGRHRWSVIASGVTAAEPGNPPAVLIGHSGTVFVITISAWDSPARGAPEIWDSASRRESIVRGHWLMGAAMKRADSLYPAAAIDKQGDMYVWENVPCEDFRYANGRPTRCKSVNVPGTVYWAYRPARSRLWHPERWVSAFRYAYDFLLPQSPHDLRVVGTRDILQAPFEAPYACPSEREPNGSYYCFDQAIQAQWTNLAQPPSSLIVGLAATDAPGYHGDHRVSAEDAYVDTLGRTHVLLSVADASTHGTDESQQLEIDPDGDVQDVGYAGIPYPNLSRIVQDRSGRFWLYSIGPDLADEHRCDAFIAAAVAGTTEGTQFGPVTEIPFARRFDCSTETRNYDVTVSSGTALANYIDGVVATNGGADWLHYRIALPANVAP